MGHCDCRGTSGGSGATVDVIVGLHSCFLKEWIGLDDGIDDKFKKRFAQLD